MGLNLKILLMALYCCSTNAGSPEGDGGVVLHDFPEISPSKVSDRGMTLAQRKREI